MRPSCVTLYIFKFCSGIRIFSIATINIYQFIPFLDGLPDLYSHSNVTSLRIFQHFFWDCYTAVDSRIKMLLAVNFKRIFFLDILINRKIFSRRNVTLSQSDFIIIFPFNNPRMFCSWSNESNKKSDELRKYSGNP